MCVLILPALKYANLVMHGLCFCMLCVCRHTPKKNVCVCVSTTAVSAGVSLPLITVNGCASVCFSVRADGSRGSVHTVLVCFVYPPVPRESINSQLDPVKRSHMTRQAFNEELVGPACRRFSAFYLFSPARVAPSLLWR